MSTNDPFSTVIGHDAVKRVLASALAHPHHGYAFVGPDGAGGHLLAESFVRALLGAASDRPLRAHPDCAILEREAAANGGMKRAISVEAVRALRERMSRSSVGGGLRVAYVPDADALNIEGVNALLKAVEEPSAGAVFVFVVHQESRLPPTLMSRLVRLPLRRVPDRLIRAWLGDRVSSREADQVLAFAHGRPGLAKRLLDDADLRSRAESAERTVRVLLETTSAGEAFAAIREEAENAEKSEDPVRMWRETIQLWQGALEPFFTTHARRAVHLAHVLIRTYRHIAGPVSPRIWLELGLSRMAQDHPIPFATLLPAPFPYPQE
jgi:DNA polymerase-3 subunit delta'